MYVRAMANSDRCFVCGLCAAQVWMPDPWHSAASADVKGIQVSAVAVNRTTLLRNCEGSCDSDAHCTGDLRCFQPMLSPHRHGQQVPGCIGGGVGDVNGYGYCYDPSAA